ncbi:MAG: phospholipase D family protein [Burkholderiales bacterium]|nr:phospholipase D family protein [Burkholderiales bacterium]
MKKTRIFVPVLCAIALSANAFDGGNPSKPLPATGTVQVAFTPEEDATGLIVKALREASKTVRVLAYSFTSNEISFALIEAKRRGIDVQVIADAEQIRRLEHNKVGLMHQAGVRVWLDEQHQSAHNKVMVIDGDGANPTVVTGSMNFTYSGQFKNAENVLILRGNKPLAEAYSANWQRHHNHASPYRP